MPFRCTFLVTVAVVLAGCALPRSQPGQAELPLAVPGSWQSGAMPGQVGDWLRQFRDPALTKLVEEAVSVSFELRGAASRLRAAGASARIAGAGRWPRLQVSGTGERSDRGGSLDTGVGGTRSERFELRGQVSWEADLWGRIADDSRAATSELAAARADYRAARLSLAANIARQWFDTSAARAQARLARDTVASFESSLETVEERYRQGIGAALDVRLARNNLADARTNLFQRRRQAKNRGRALETLLGRYPAGDIQPPNSLPAVPQAVPAGLPARLLEQRPDLVAAAARLEAAGYRRASTDKNRLPAISLSASGGASSEALREVIDLDSLIWTLAANIVQPVFQGGRLAAQRELAAARESEALNDYARAALTAFREVEDGLDSESYLSEQENAARAAAAEARQAEKLARDQYKRGLVDIITLLESQRRRFNADSALIEVMNARLLNRINLHLALGGDYSVSPGPRTVSTE